MHRLTTLGLAAAISLGTMQTAPGAQTTSGIEVRGPAEAAEACLGAFLQAPASRECNVTRIATREDRPGICGLRARCDAGPRGKRRTALVSTLADMSNAVSCRGRLTVRGCGQVRPGDRITGLEEIARLCRQAFALAPAARICTDTRITAARRHGAVCSIAATCIDNKAGKQRTQITVRPEVAAKLRACDGRLTDRPCRNKVMVKPQRVK